MSDKALRILKVLYMNKNTPMTGKMLAVMLDMSERSVNTYLKEVSDFCSKNQIPFVCKRGLGIYLDLNSCDIHLITELIGQGTPHYNTTERVQYILQILLDGWSNYTMSMLAEELYASRQTVISDLEAAEQWFGSYNLQLIKKSKIGISITGDEWDRRRALVALNNEKKMECEQEPCQCDFRLGKERFARFKYCYSQSLVEQVCRAVELFEQRFDNILVDYCYVMLVEYLCVQRLRMKKGFHCLNPDGGISDVVQPAPMCCLLMESLEAVFSQQYPSNERDYVYILLSCVEFQKDNQALWGGNSCTSREIVEQICHKIIEYLSDVTGLEFSKESRLLSGVESFLNKCIIRTHYGIAIDNPFLEEVKNNYGAIFTTCFGLGCHVRDVIGKLPSEHEIAYLTLLVGGALVRIEKRVNAVFVGAGNLLIAEMAVRKLEKALDGLRIIGVYSAERTEELNNLDCDLVITTLKDYSSSHPSICVTPIIDDRDILKLQKACNDIYTDKLEGPDSLSLQDFIRPEFILLDVEAVSKDKLIGMGCDILKEHHCVTDEYFKEIMHREMISSTEIGNGVAIPHGIENTVLVPSICMLRLKQKVDWGNAPVDIIFMLALNFNDIHTTRRFFKLFYEKAGEPRVLDALRAAGSSGEVIKILQL